MDNKALCPVCKQEGFDITMTYYPPTKMGARDYYWECPECGVTVYPAPWRHLTPSILKAKKKCGSSRSKKHGGKKPVVKRWYQGLE